jgi:hypothetical protein
VVVEEEEEKKKEDKEEEEKEEGQALCPARKFFIDTSVTWFPLQQMSFFLDSRSFGPGAWRLEFGVENHWLQCRWHSA